MHIFYKHTHAHMQTTAQENLRGFVLINSLPIDVPSLAKYIMYITLYLVMNNFMWHIPNADFSPGSSVQWG